jgi:hypothetical protein
MVAWSWVDFEMMTGWGLFIASFLGIYYITKVAVNIVAEDIPALKSKMVIVNDLQFLIMLTVFNLFIFVR